MGQDTAFNDLNKPSVIYSTLYWRTNNLLYNLAKNTFLFN